MFANVTIKTPVKILMLVSIMLSLVFASAAQAYERYEQASSFIEVPAPQYNSMRHQSNDNRGSLLLPMIYAQNQRSNLRSRSEVMEEVKRRYDASVLRISLNKKREVYNVRLLMPNGKVRNIQVSARR